MGRIQKFGVIGVLFLLVGCAFSPVRKANVDAYKTSIVESKSFNISEETAVGASNISLKWLEYEVELESPELGLLKTKPKNVIIPDVCDCGTWNRRVISGSADSIMQVQIDAEEADAATIKIKHYCTARFTGRNLFYMPTRRETYQCASRGVVERQFWDAMERFFSKNQGKIAP